MRHAAVCTAVVILAAIPAFAQEAAPALELQLGGSFLLADSDLSHQASVEAGGALWFSRSWGASLRRGMSVSEHMASFDYGDGTRTGSRAFRHWTPTLRYRHVVETGLEVNIGVGVTFAAYDHLTWRPGAANPEVGYVYSIGGIATEWLFGNWVTPRLGIKGGVIVYPFLDEKQAFSPIVFAVVPFF